MKKFTLLTILVLTSMGILFAQSPDACSYQAVVRNSSGDIVATQLVSVKLSILQGNASGAVQYSEKHSVTTNQMGLINLKIGDGTQLSGTFSTIKWGSFTHFIKVEMDANGGSSYSHYSTAQLLSVPYALHAKTVENDQVDDADADASNEIQTMSLSGTQLSLSNGGGTVTLPSSGGGDNWGTQTVITDATLSGAGTTASKLSVVGDLSDDQTLSISGNSLSISEGNTVTLPAATANVWQNSSVGVQYNDGKVGIGHDPADDTGLLQVWEEDNVGIEAVNNSASYPTMFLQNKNGKSAIFDGTVIVADGKLGIGTSDPLFGLDIVNSTTESFARIQSNTASATMIIERGASGTGAITMYKTGGAVSFFTGLLSSSNYKISTTNPTLNGLEVERDGDVVLSDELQSENSGDANMMPYAYGHINSSGQKVGGTSNIGTVTKMSTGQYKIEIAGLSDDCAVIVTPNQGSASLTGVVSARNSSAFAVTMWEALSSGYKDAGFSFIVYKP